MTHFGIICPAESGHLNTMLPLGKVLQQRGHRLTLITLADAQQKTLAAGLEFSAIGDDLFPQGRLEDCFAYLGQLKGMAALKYTVELFKRMATVVLRDAPQVLRDIGVEALLVDQSVLEGGTVAEFLGIPFVTICSAVVLHRDPQVPPFNTPWQYSPTKWGRLRNRLGYQILSRVSQPIREVIVDYRQQWNLSPLTHPNEAYSPLAQISHQPAELEFPRQNLPQWFHFTGPYHYSSLREPVAFPWEKLTGQPIIYASMGTLQNRLIEVFEKIASACENLDAQLVMTLGGSVTPESLPQLSGNPLVVGYAPQLELLQKASLTITHAGMNTTLESLTNGVPMIALPVANDQLGIASRIAWSGTGEMIPLKKLRSTKLHNGLRKVLTEEFYRRNAVRLQKAIQQSGGVNRAADIIEQAVSTGKPVIAQP